jgi:hypothetical protein
VGIETIIGDPFDGRLENGCVYGCGSVDTKASLGLVLALLDHMQHWGEDLKPNLVVCAVEEIGCSGAPLFARGRGLNLSQLVVADPAMCAPIYTIKARRPSSAPANRLPASATRNRHDFLDFSRDNPSPTMQNTTRIGLGRPSPY